MNIPGKARERRRLENREQRAKSVEERDLKKRMKECTSSRVWREYLVAGID